MVLMEIDIIIIRRQAKIKGRDFYQLDFLFRLLNDINLIEFKGPTDTLDWKDYSHLMAMVELYRIKSDHPANSDIRLFTIASTIPKQYRHFLKLNRLELNREMKGLYALAGATNYDHYVLVLNELKPDQKNELILFFSSKYHDRMRTIISNQENILIMFLIQELFQKERQKMKFKIKDEDLVVRDLKEAIQRLPLEFRLAGLKPQQRLEGLKPEEIVKALRKEDPKRLIELSKNIELN